MKDKAYTDEELISRFQEGDEYAYIELVHRYKDRLMNFAYRFFGDRGDAEDVVQDTFMKLYTHKHYYRNIAKFSTWIYTIASNLAKTELRKRKRRPQTPISMMGLEGKDWDIPVDDRTNKEIEGRYNESEIQRAMLSLPLHFRTAVILRDIQELSYEEISNILDIPLGTVKSRINRARLQLQEELKHVKSTRRT
ncbi:MAG: sigma-70 family RNA polymerase sigma factor [Fidelibacterota bacterium]